MAEVSITFSSTSYDDETPEQIYSNTGAKDLDGYNYSDLETGVPSETKFFYFRHDGLEPIYDVGIYLRSLGTKWGGYVGDSPDSYFPFNPNFFKYGGVSEEGNPTTSTEDYEFLRTIAYNNPEMGVRVHPKREDVYYKWEGLGNANQGLNFSPLIIPSDSLDYTKSANQQLNGYVYPEPEDSSKISKDGDEAKIGLSLQFPEEVEGSGIIQYSVAIKYRYTI